MNPEQPQAGEAKTLGEAMAELEEDVKAKREADAKTVVVQKTRTMGPSEVSIRSDIGPAMLGFSETQRRKREKEARRQEIEINRQKKAHRQRVLARKRRKAEKRRRKK